MKIEFNFFLFSEKGPQKFGKGMKKKDNEKCGIMLELCKNRSLYDLLQKSGYISEFEVRNYMFQIIQGVKYLHNKMIIHRDLKPSTVNLKKGFNILLIKVMDSKKKYLKKNIILFHFNIP